MTISPLRLTALSDFFSGNDTLDFTPPTAQFGPVPPGYIWTGTIAACISQQITSGSQSQTPLGTEANNDALASIIWTLYRNGAAEQTWIGLSSLCNVQAFGNDVLQIAGQVPSIGFPINSPFFDLNHMLPVTFSFLGYAGEESEIALVVPFISTSVQSAPAQAIGMPSEELDVLSALQLTAGTTTLLDSGSTIQGYQLWAATIDLSVATQGTARADCSIQDAQGKVYLQGSVVANGTTTEPGNATVAHDLDLRGIYLQQGASPLSFVSDATFTGTGNGFRASATVYFSFVLIV